MPKVVPVSYSHHGFWTFTASFDFPVIIARVKTFLDNWAVEHLKPLGSDGQVHVQFIEKPFPQPTNILFLGTFASCIPQASDYDHVIYFSGEADYWHPVLNPGVLSPNCIGFDTSLARLDKIAAHNVRSPGCEEGFYWVPFAAMSNDERLDKFLKLAVLPSRENVYPVKVSERSKTACCVVSSNLFGSPRAALLKEFVEYPGFPSIEAGGRLAVKGMVAVQRVKGAHFQQSLIDYYQQYQFAFVFENCQERGYVTEKIVRAFEAGCIPVYFGPREALALFNQKAFLYVGGRDDVPRVAQRICDLLKDPRELQQMAEEPIFDPGVLDYDQIQVPQVFRAEYVEGILEKHGVQSVLTSASIE